MVMTMLLAFWAIQQMDALAALPTRAERLTRLENLTRINKHAPINFWGDVPASVNMENVKLQHPNLISDINNQLMRFPLYLAARDAYGNIAQRYYMDLTDAEKLLMTNPHHPLNPGRLISAADFCFDRDKHIDINPSKALVG